MSKTLTITLPDDLMQALDQIKKQTNQTAEEIILQLLAQKLISPPPTPDPKTDPLLNLAGCITTDLPDVADNHDNYIGRAIYEEMHTNE